MNKKVVLNWLSLVALVATSAYVPMTAASLSTSTSNAALNENSSQFVKAQPKVLADSDDSDDSEDPDTTPTPEPTPDSSTPENPLIPTESKPTILDPSNWSPPQPLQPILGFTFPTGTANWTIPVRAAAFVDIAPDPSERFTPVGMVEVGANPETETESQIYLVSIDLASRETRVKGQLVPVAPPDISPDALSVAAADTLDVIFLRIPQKLNPERINSPYEEFQGLPSPPDSMATIYADGVCFVVKTGDGTGNGGGGDSDDSDNDDSNSSVNGRPIYNTYCSKPTGPNGLDAPLSVMDNFPSQYAELQSSISEVATSFNLENRIQNDEIISTLESILGIQDCASALTEEACGSDIIGAPVTEQYFRRQFNQAFGGNGDGNGGDRDHENGGENGDAARIAADGNRDNGDRDNDNNRPNQSPTPIEVAAVKVLKPIEFPDSIVQPGDYVMHFWFDSNAVFYAVTLTGVTTDSTVVTNQQIPGVPATFIDRRREGPMQPDSQISAWKLLKWCTCRETC